MRYKLLAALVFITCTAQAQQVNPVPDYVFANRMSVGRNAVTDTLAYFSIGPRYGAIRGFMPPMVVDTALVTGGTKRNGLTIFSIQKNKYVYWDSVGSKWAEMAGTGGSAITGTGAAGYMPEFTTSTNIDSTTLYHTSGRFGIGTTSPLTRLHVNDEIMMSKILVDTVGGQATTSPWRTQGVRTNITGVSHWHGLTEGDGTIGGGDFTFFKARRGDSAMLSNNEIWYNEWRGKHRSNDANWKTNDSSKVASDIVRYAIHSNSTPTSIRLFRAKNSSNTMTDYIIIDPVQGDIDINGARLDIATNLRVQDIATIQDTLKVGTVTSGNSNTISRGLVQLGSETYATFNMTSYNDDPTNSSFFAFLKARGTAASPALVQSGDVLGALTFEGYFNAASSFPFRSGARIEARAEENFGSTAVGTNIRFLTAATGSTSVTERLRLTAAGELLLGSTTDAGAFALQVTGAIYNTTTITTGAPTSGTAKPWRLGEAATVSPTSPNRTIRVEIDGTVYYLHAKTTND